MSPESMPIGEAAIWRSWEFGRNATKLYDMYTTCNAFCSSHQCTVMLLFFFATSALALRVLYCTVLPSARSNTQETWKALTRPFGIPVETLGSKPRNSWLEAKKLLARSQVPASKPHALGSKACYSTESSSLGALSATQTRSPACRRTRFVM